MNQRIRKIFTLVAISALVGNCSLFAQPPAPPEPAPAVAVLADSDPADVVIAPDVIFSNLDRTPAARFNIAGAFTLAGQKAGDNQTESWYAISFTPREDVQATVLAAAVTYISGERLVALGIYSDDDGTVGDLLPGAEGTTAQIPDSGECCQLARVILPGDGVALAAGAHYWLVASPDNVNGPTFHGEWDFSNRAISAYLLPPFPWNAHQPGAWPAAQIRGTKVKTLGSPDATQQPPNLSADAPDSTVLIFKNLGPSPYRYFTVGALVSGKDVASEPEAWEAIPFTPRADVHATVLAAAIGHVSGTKLVNLGVYSDNAGTVGTLLPGGQGSTSDIPEADECCQIAKVTLPGTGVALKAGTQYWLVATPDNVNAPDFHGQWQNSTLALDAYQEPEHFINWTNFSGSLLAAEIRGTLP